MKKVCSAIVWVMCITVLILPFSALADFQNPDAEIVDMNTDIIIEFILQYMRALGYDFFVDGVEQYGQLVEDWLYQELMDYVNSIPSIANIAQWLLPLTVGWDGWDNMIGNQYFVEDVNDFMTWLNTKYGFGSGDVTVVAPDWSFGQYYGFLNSWDFLILNYHSDGAYRDRRYWIGAEDNLYQCYGIFIQIGNEQDFGVLMKSIGSFKFRYSFNNKNNDPDTVGPTGPTTVLNNCSVGENFYYYRFDYSFWQSQYSAYVGLPIYHFETLNDALLAFDINDPTQSTEIVINGDDVILPDDDPSYTPGDGVTLIEDDGEVIKIYMEVEFPDSINVSNLPSAIIPNGIEAIDLSDAFTPISSFVNTYSDAIGVLTDISYRLPIPLWSIAFALIAVDILAGIIHTFKEH